MDSGKTCVVVLVEGLAPDPSGACSAWAVASRNRGKHTGVSVCPDVVCYLTLHGATQHANRFQPLFGERGGIKCHILGTVPGRALPLRRQRSSEAGTLDRLVAAT